MLLPTSRLANLLLLITATAFSSGAMAQDASTELPEGVAAVVNGQDIPQASVDNILQQMTEAGEQADNTRVLEELINLEVLSQAAKAEKLDEEADIAATLKLQYTQTMANAYLALRGNEMTITDEDLRAEYDAQAGNLDLSEYRASHILLETEEVANKVIAELQAGKDFAEAATEYSIDPSANGGDLGWFTAASMDPAFAEAVAGMEVGDVTSSPVKTEYGYHVINLVDERGAAVPDFNSVKDGLSNLVMRRNLAQLVEELKADADIQTQ